MDKLNLSRPQTEQLAQAIQHYCQQEFEVDLGQFEAEFLLQFVVDKVAPEIYNQALLDAQALLENRVNDWRDDLYQIEKPSLLR
ncbi:DUF2164 domain-containing protein [Ferrimonas senticii]|uniref:DUF2164 domain-containing protein n=1 Tax=Ferrimonas senticii TaxID=394566 RepID=UPI0003F5687B|nr:DUF2164 domain-containing protein [Ferrimonas senticii]